MDIWAVVLWPPDFIASVLALVVKPVKVSPPARNAATQGSN